MNSKNKGNTFERKIANLLSNRFSKFTGIEKSFKRNADSGSFFGGKNQARVSTHDMSKASFGDLVCPMNFKYAPECKHYKNPPSLSSIIKQEYKDWDDWIAQSTQDCENSGKSMSIIIKYNNVPEMVIVDDLRGMKPFGYYKKYYLVSLEEFLSMDDSMYFTDTPK